MISKAQALFLYLQEGAEETLAKPISKSIDQNDNEEVLDLAVYVSLPQRPVEDIKEWEDIRVVFPKSGAIPRCYSLREDFPWVPHLNLTHESTERSLCLYDQSWEEAQFDWSPYSYVERIRTWLSDTACGILHRPGQPLEPLLAQPRTKLIVPHVALRNAGESWIEEFDVSVQVSGSFRCFIAHRMPLEERLKIPFVIFQAPKTTHGLIQKIPENLRDLAEFIDRSGGNFLESVSTQISQNAGLFLKNGAWNKNVFFLVLMPKTRHLGGEIEEVEKWAFISIENNERLLLDLGVAGRDPGTGTIAPLVGNCQNDPEKLGRIRIEAAGVYPSTSVEGAALANGDKVNHGLKLVLIGAGALGSQLYMNLLRSGFGSWTIIDNDLFLPHNAYRHSLDFFSFGCPKAEALAITGNRIFDGKCDIQPFTKDALAISDQDEALKNRLAEADVILDCAASIVVSRGLSSRSVFSGRKVSVFLNPDGQGLVVLSEAADQSVPLEWVEAEYYHAVATAPLLAGHLRSGSQSDSYSYGNSCRDVSKVIPQDYFAIHSGVAARVLRKTILSTSAGVSIHTLDPANCGVSSFEIIVSVPITVNVGEWRIMVSTEILAQLSELRAARLPLETGGVLVGVVDRVHKYLCILRCTEAPSDSYEYPTCFIRGKNGLRDKIQSLSDRSAGNLCYLGEWHSHPPATPSSPSSDDRNAMAQTARLMNADNLPTLMAIVSDHNVNFVLRQAFSDEEFSEQVHSDGGAK